MRLIGEISCSGFRPKLIIIVEQFGLAIIPLCFKISSGFTSGTTRGTSGSIRNALELSITIAPRLAASGANVLEIEPPANKAISIFSKDSGFASSTTNVFPFTVSSVPAERADANNFKFSYGKLRSSISVINSAPTAPVAPRIATLGFFITISPCSNIINNALSRKLNQF